MQQLTSFSVIRDLVHWWVPSLPPNEPVWAATACLPRTPAKPPSTICYAIFKDEAHTSWPRHMQHCNPALKSCLSVQPTASAVTVGDIFFPCLCLAACVFDSTLLCCCSDGCLANWVAAACCSPQRGCWTQGAVGHPCVLGYWFGLASSAAYWHLADEIWLQVCGKGLVHPNYKARIFSLTSSSIYSDILLFRYCVWDYCIQPN